VRDYFITVMTKKKILVDALCGILFLWIYLCSNALIGSEWEWKHEPSKFYQIK